MEYFYYGMSVFYLNMHIYFIFTVSEFFIGNIDGELSYISKVIDISTAVQLLANPDPNKKW